MEYTPLKPMCEYKDYTNRNVKEIGYAGSDCIHLICGSCSTIYFRVQMLCIHPDSVFVFL